jgi:MFS family permease
MVQSAVTKQDKKTLWFVILASSVGTLIEWYDFYIFGSLAIILSEQFFPSTNPTAALLSTLATFAAGFIVRPFGAIVFGRLGDVVGRKYTFLVTLVLMGAATFAIGIVPGYETIGLAAPVIVLLLRLLQGLALGGEYGGAATYVAEHAPAAKRGFYTSFIQTTASLGLFVSIGVILAVRHYVGVREFNEWGWRIPFLLSALLVGVSILIRLKMKESPLFARIKAEGKTSKNPIKESFGNKENLRMVLIALFGATAGQGVVWYTGQFYAMTFLETTCRIEFVQTRNIIAYALMLGTPLFIYFGWLSDQYGRKIIMMLGMILAVVLYRPIYKHMYAISDISQKTEITEKREQLESEESDDNGGVVKVIQVIHHYDDQTQLKETTRLQAGGKAQVKQEVTLHGDLFYGMIGVILLQIVLVTMVYGPIAAFLVEIFPTRIRYTSMSLPYHIGNGVFGGLTPFIATALYTMTQTPDRPAGDPFAGLWYPIAIAGLSFVVGMIFLHNKKKGEVMED